MRLLAVLLASALALIAALHLYWAAGGRLARAVAVPEVGGRPAIHPGPLACAAVALLLVAAALLLLGRGGVIWLPGPRLLRVGGAWAVGAVFALRSVGDFRLFGLFRQVTGTHFARNDALIYTPLSLLLAAGALSVACCGDGRT